MADLYRAVSASKEALAAVGKQRKKHGKSFFSVVIVLLLLFLMAFAVYQCARFLTVELNTLRTQEITDTSYTDLEFYIFRDETPIVCGTGNVFSYNVRNGEKVAVNTVLGQSYTVMDAETVHPLQKQLDLYSNRAAMLNRIFSNSNTADVSTAADRTERTYREILKAADGGQMSVMSANAEEMLSALDTWHTLTGMRSGQSALNSAEEAIRALTDSLTPGGTFSTDKAGWFYYGSDGLETYFSYAHINELTPAELRTLTTVTEDSPASGTVGCMVYTDVWYAASLMTLEQAAGFKIGADYVLLCDDGVGTQITLTAERIETDSDGAMVVFSSQNMPESFSFERRICGQIAVSRISGYRIPTTALVSLKSKITGETVTGVYILEGNRVEFRRVMVSVTREGYVIAKTYEQVNNLLTTMSEVQQNLIREDGWSFLQLNDRIITSGNNLYEGKIID